MSPQPARHKSGWRAWASEWGDWWHSPASASGQHHHGETQWQHAREVFALAARMWRRVPQERLRKSHTIRRSFLRAAIFHDVGKAVDPKAHDLASYAWLLPKDRLAAYFALTHMGRWQTPAVRDILECAPISRFHRHPTLRFIGEMLQACDYFAAACP